MYAERQQAQPTLAIILIDSLDEAVTTTGTTLVKLLTQLSKSTSLPSWVRFVMTSRPERRVLRGFEPLKPYHLREKSDESLADVRQYIEDRIDQPALQDQLQVNQVQPQTLISEITNLSHRNFLYTTLLLNDIEAGRQALDNLASLPKSIDDIYHGFLSRFSEEDWSDRYKPIFGVLTVAQEPISEKQISNFTKIDSEDVRDSIRIAQQFFDVDLDGQNKETYSIFHQSLRDYLLDGDRNSNFWCNEQKQHQRIIDYYRDGKKPWDWNDSYLWNHLTYHLSKANKAVELRTLLLNFDWLQAKLKVTNVNLLLTDFDFLPEDRELLLVKGAIQLSAHLVSRDSTLLWGQIYGRLMSQKTPGIQELLDKEPRDPWLQPLSPALTSPNGVLLRTLEGHGSYSYINASYINAVAITPDGQLALSGLADKTLKLWDLQSGQCLSTWEGHNGSVNTVAITPDGQLALSGSADKTLKLRDLQSGQGLSTWEGHNGSVNTVAITPDSQLALSGSLDCTLKLWNLQSGECFNTWRGHSNIVYAVAITPDGQKALSAARDKTLKLWDLQSGRCLNTWQGHEGSVNTVVITPNGKQAVSVSADNTLKIWDLGRCRLLVSWVGEHSISSCAVAPDGMTFVAGEESGRVYFLRLRGV